MKSLRWLKEAVKTMKRYKRKTGAVRNRILNSLKGEIGYFRLFLGQENILTLKGRLKKFDKDFLLIESEKGRDIVRIEDLHSVNLLNSEHVKEFEKSLSESEKAKLTGVR